MRIEPSEKYIKGLADLWHKVFGDSYSYINLLFEKEFFLCDTFIKQENNEIVSVLYLLNCCITFEDKVYKGKYLYAAATDPEYRGKGYMAELIREAQSYCENNEIDFISLVPANEHLYAYYSKFGFVTAMRRYEAKINASPVRADINSVDYSNWTDAVNSIRTAYKCNAFCFDKKDLQYALNCITAVGGKIFTVSDESCFIVDKETETVEEFISTKENFTEDFEKMLSCFGGEITVYSPYNLSDYGKTEIKKYGMIYSINKNLKRDWSLTDIYMNLALD